MSVTPRLLALALLLSPALAQADAIQMLREPCKPPRVVGIRNHAEVCLDPPPTTCPPGWRGIPGGECALHHCADDTACDPGKRCTEVPLCMAARERSYCFSEGDAPFDRSLLAGPPRECSPDERFYEEPTAPCGGADTCSGTCKPGKLCLAPGATAAREAPRPPPETPKPPSETPRGGGCAGCQVGADEAGGATLAALMMGLGVGALAGRGQRGTRSTRPSA